MTTNAVRLLIFPQRIESKYTSDLFGKMHFPQFLTTNSAESNDSNIYWPHLTTTFPCSNNIGFRPCISLNLPNVRPPLRLVLSKIHLCTLSKGKMPNGRCRKDHSSDTGKKTTCMVFLFLVEDDGNKHIFVRNKARLCTRGHQSPRVVFGERCLIVSACRLAVTKGPRNHHNSQHEISKNGK